MNSQATPLLNALIATGESAEARGWLDTILTALGCMIPISVCLYLADVQPLFAVGSVKFIHADLVVACVVILVLIRALLNGFHSFPKIFFLPFAFLFLSTVISTLAAEDSLRASAALMQMIEFGALCWCFSLVTSSKSFLRILNCTLGWFVFETLVATGQFLAGDPVPHGTLMVHQQYAMFTGFSAAIAFAMFCAANDRKRRWAYLALLLILLWGTLLGQERAPWLAFILSGAAIVYYQGKRRLRVLLGLGIIVLCGALLVVSVPRLRDMTISRLSEVQNTNERTNSLLGRLALWTAAANLFFEHPIVGVGPKNFISIAPEILTRDEMGGEYALDPHNVWIGILAEQGLIGLVTYAVVNWAIFFMAVGLLRQPLVPAVRMLCLAYLAYHVFWLTMVYSYLGKGEGHIHFMMIGLMMGQLRSKYSPEARSGESSVSAI